MLFRSPAAGEKALIGEQGSWDDGEQGDGRTRMGRLQAVLSKTGGRGKAIWRDFYRTEQNVELGKREDQIPLQAGGFLPPAFCPFRWMFFTFGNDCDIIIKRRADGRKYFAACAVYADI